MGGILSQRDRAIVTYRKKLIEVGLPLDAINRASAREKSIRRGHPSTLHLWWARRPLAACRAVLFASLVDDPSARPDVFPTAADQEAERRRLFDIIERLVTWENSMNQKVLAEARAEIAKSTNGRMPGVLDPFCGGGSIPLEAQRLGLEVFASDLNPVAVLITKALVEIPPKFADVAPVNPESRTKLDMGGWGGATGLADDVRYYGEFMSRAALARIGDQYPRARTEEGSESTVIAWLWARTVQCPNPGCRTTTPLLNSFVLSKRKGREAWVEATSVPDSRTIQLTVRTGPGAPKGGSVSRVGGSCLACDTTIPLAYIRDEGRRGRMGQQLVATVSEGDRARQYLSPTEEHVRAADVEIPDDLPETELPRQALGFRVQSYGLTRHIDLFTPRQLVTLDTFSKLVEEARERCLADGAKPDYADAVATYLSLCIGRLANRGSSQCFWDPGGESIMQVFARNALPMVWVFAEANPFSDSSGNFIGHVSYLVSALERLPAHGSAEVRQLNATAIGPPSEVCVATDPPYYDNVPYADLSDFFYVWLRRAARNLHPDLFSTVLVPKVEELIAEPARHDGWEGAATFFEQGLRQFFVRVGEVQSEEFPFTLFYAFRQAEGDAGEGRFSTGWETMLQGLIDSGCAVSGTWPMRTEQAGGLREVGRNALASSIVIACRPRATEAVMATRKEFITALRSELPEALRVLQHGNVAPVDLAQAAIGPGMAIYSRYAKVIEAGGTSMRVRTALELINQILNEVLSQQEDEFDSATRWAIPWFEQHATKDGPYGDAEVLARAKGVAVNGLVQDGLVHAGRGKVRLLKPEELSATWDPSTDSRLRAWEVTHHLVRVLADGGEEAAAAILRKVGSSYGTLARDLAYRLYIACESRKWVAEALGYNQLVVSWPEIERLAGRQPKPEQQLLG